MNRRLWFLTGHLSGILVRATLCRLYFSSMCAKGKSPNTTAPMQILVPIINQTPPNSTTAPTFSKGWQSRSFHGQPYYLMPAGEEYAVVPQLQNPTVDVDRKKP